MGEASAYCIPWPTTWGTPDAHKGTIRVTTTLPFRELLRRKMCWKKDLQDCFYSNHLARMPGDILVVLICPDTRPSSGCAGMQVIHFAYTETATSNHPTVYTEYRD